MLSPRLATSFSPSFFLVITTQGERKRESELTVLISVNPTRMQRERGCH